MREYIWQDSDDGRVSTRIQELVRCKDCKYGEKQNNAKGEPMIECVLMYDDAWLKDPDWFCANGKRR